MPSPLSAIRLLRPTPPSAAPAVLVEPATLDGIAPLPAFGRRSWARLVVVGVVLVALAVLAVPGLRGDGGAAAAARPQSTDATAVAGQVGSLVQAGLAARDAEPAPAPLAMASLSPEVRQAVATAIVAQVARAQVRPVEAG